MSNAIRSNGTKIQRGVASVITPQTISSIAVVGSLATLTSAVAHGLNTGDIITITGATPAAYNGTWAITKLAATTLTFTTLSAPGGAATVMGTYTAQAIVWATLEESTDIKFGGISIASIDVTHLLSTSKEFIAGMKDNGACDISCNFTNGPVQTLMRGDCNLGTTSPYQVIIPSGAQNISIGFNAFHTKYGGPDVKVDGELGISITLKITGDITITTA